MRRSLEFSDQAIDDLNRIYDWIIGGGGTAEVATAYVGRMRSKCLGLVDFPGIGTSRAGGRTIVFERRATILYRVTRDKVVVVSVYHRGRDPGA